jgi:hypothetical protein
MTKFTDIMLDIETLGTGTNAAIIQIGAVAFYADGPNPALFTNSPELLLADRQGFRVNVDLGKSRHPGVINASTVEWWLGQSDEARASVTKAEGRVELGTALQMFASWVEWVGNGRSNVRLWSNGPTFDEMIVRQAFERYGLDLNDTISFRGSRCCRTMFEVARGLGWNPKEAARMAPDDIVKHDGLSDAVFQARSVVAQRSYTTLFRADIDRRVPTSSGPGEIA